LALEESALDERADRSVELLEALIRAGEGSHSPSTLAVMPAEPWPDLRDEDRWLTAAMEERLRTSERSPDELRARARELRDQAEQSHVKGVRDAALALAERYEEAAAARLGAR